MRDLKKAIIVITLALTVFVSTTNTAHAELPPKGKAFLVMCGYGTVGGALLGFATLAFGTNPRAIAQGASLGLYAGIIFGSYVITSHNSGQVGEEPVEEYNPGYPPPNDPYAPGGGGGYGAPEPEDSAPRGLFDFRYQESRDTLAVYNGSATKNVAPPIYMNLYQATF